MTKDEVKWLFREIRKRYPTFMKDATNDVVRSEMDKWVATLPEGLCIGGAMEALNNYSKPYVPNLADFTEVADSYSIDSLMWTTIRERIMKISRDEHLAICQEEGRKIYENGKN